MAEAEALRLTESNFGWLDYDERAAQRMREVLGAFDDRETVDSLGLGVVRDSLADQLFPGTSTIQTRARYLLFVPWHYRQLEGERVPSPEFASRLRDAELRLIDALKEGGVGANEGLFGFVAGRRVKRLPSVVYWNGLARYGIRRHHLSIAEHRARLGWYYRRLDHVELDDDRQATGPTVAAWDTYLPPPIQGFPDAPTDLQLTPEEAAYLQERITTSCPGTLWARLAEQPERAAGAERPWDLSTEGESDHIRDLLHHGRCFSDVMRGAQTVYNLLLAEQAASTFGHGDAAAVTTEETAHLAAWADEMQEQREALTQWSAGLNDFWDIVAKAGSVPGHTKVFTETWIRFALADPEDVAANRDVENLIVRRERQLKGRQARLSQVRALENWGGAAFGRRFTYRWPNAQRLLADLAAGLT